jgi:hypothetical protein
MLEKALHVKERDGIRMEHRVSDFPKIFCCAPKVDTEDYSRAKITEI